MNRRPFLDPNRCKYIGSGPEGIHACNLQTGHTGLHLCPYCSLRWRVELEPTATKDGG